MSWRGYGYILRKVRQTLADGSISNPHSPSTNVPPAVPVRPKIVANYTPIAPPSPPAISDMWHNFSVSLPPGFASTTYPEPIVSDPTLPTAPIYTIPVVPDPVYITPITSSAPYITVDIPVPTLSPIPLFTLDIPQINIPTVPTGNINWAYADYVSDLLNNMESKYNNNYSFIEEASGLMGNRNQKIHKRIKYMEMNGFPDLSGVDATLSMMVFDNSSIDYILRSKHSVERDQMYVENRSILEQIKIKLNQGKNELTLDYAISLAKNMIRSINHGIDRFNMLINEYKILFIKYASQIDYNTMLLGDFENRIEGESIKSSINQGLVRSYNINVNSQKALVALFSSQMNLAKKLSDLMYIDIEIQKAETRALIVKAEGDVAVIGRSIIKQGVLAAIEKLKIAPYLMDALVSRKSVLTGLVEEARATYSAALAEYRAKWDIILMEMGEYDKTLSSEKYRAGIDVDETYASLDTLRGRNAQSISTAANSTFRQVQEMYNKTKNSFDDLASNVEQNNIRVEMDEARDMENDAVQQAELDAAKLLALANLVAKVSETFIKTK